MRAIILAAGRGQRLRPHTDHTPKPLLEVRGQPLIVWHLQALARAGVRNVVVNTAWLEDRFEPLLGDGSRFGVSITYSREQRDHGQALETAGGIAKALPGLMQQRSDRSAPIAAGSPDLDRPFWVVAGDVFIPGFDFAPASASAFERQPSMDAQLWLVPNAAHHPQGDFALDATQTRIVDAPGLPRLTWASVGLFRPRLFVGIEPGTRMALRPLLDDALRRGALGAALWHGDWTDVGTVERWQALRAA
jgi:N-acetyl-alpha-D-muramate 1-phosphate uridylyltransferase